ncbi:hypothetical protein PHYSODRAFT_288984 [Phytophthora sojae]|uniref:RxLR effector protein n=2 Tax=Phytophthora sojae TaxID=67593 RepID=G5ABQ5_PHYSP|nr:hypothetical protein PHYSODRAFT_288984 [Phytophthora sojae]AEK81321.1 Avh433 [Phytophthora sojae]AEK81322.1 Avh433 [Phytophthora sojae]AEK81323.1 Avh433 [Phytophthora sojae]EGZ06780.1 hypothetical protein PHYSODRAFT_288984 [Phytophthora sojae]|eukprot:XP_009537544.1 hypothetical protein PHYSODRAFT_288984 [Phytophthora sojae]
MGLRRAFLTALVLLALLDEATAVDASAKEHRLGDTTSVNAPLPTEMRYLRTDNSIKASDVQLAKANAVADEEERITLPSLTEMISTLQEQLKELFHGTPDWLVHLVAFLLGFNMTV